ncbi:beta-phosphoglucomutase [Rhizosphaericola mali]|uniref:Beta-phosphoglucomutase n=1 Tax=Rhizosphaericola mali TaxID=2545455 RepID=A0A5P2G3K4_9BACT|nr:beta-phosphoglucomutase [Rhizosphaericola mali]QES90396.1 beta-phosphoglucomutase [Rhizosphaericola mali]
MIKACLFDLDGVVVDTAVYHYKAWKKLANSLGFDFTEVQNEELKGVSRMDSLKKILAWGGVSKSGEEMNALATQKNEWYVDMIQQIKPGEELPGAKEFLQKIREAGYKTALGSASKNAGIILNNLGITNLFDAIIDGNSVTHSKPDPEVFLKGAEAVGVQPNESVVFEDAVAGIEAAIAGGMYSVGIGQPEVLTKADIVVPGLYDMSIEKLKSLEKISK